MNNNRNFEEMSRKNIANQMDNILVGYARLSKSCRAVNIAINTESIGDCHTYTTKDGQSYIPLVISLPALRKVLEGERVVTTISQLIYD